MRKKLKFISIGSIIILILAMSLIVQNTALAGLSDVTVTLKDASSNNISDTSTAVNTTTIAFDPDGDILTGYGIGIVFDSFDLTAPGGGVVNGDVAITQPNGGDDITKGVADRSGTGVRIPIDTQSDAPSDPVTITISNGHLTTPAVADTYKISILIIDLGDDGLFGGAGGDADTLIDGSFAAVVIGTNQVQISGTVDPTLTLTLSDTTCGLGALVSTAANTCQYDTTVSTNATSGYTAYIRDDGNLKNATNDINDVAGGTTTVGTEEYGVATSSGAGGLDITATESGADCTTANGGASDVNAKALTTSDQSYAAATAPISADVTTLCHSASISGTTPAGVYISTVTITVVGNF